MESYPLKWIESNVAVGYSPKSYTDLETLKLAGITAIVNLCQECYDLHEIEKDFGFHVHHLPVMDEGAPSLEELEQTLEWMTDQLSTGGKVLVHCRFGIGRTGTVITAYLLKTGLSTKQALKKLAPTPSRPMSRAQWDLLEDYADRLETVSRAEFDAVEHEKEPANIFFKKYMQMKSWFNK